MEKEIVKSYEKFSRYKYKTYDKAMKAHIFEGGKNLPLKNSFYVLDDGGLLLVDFNSYGVQINLEWMINHLHLMEGNIFWEDEKKTELFNFFINMCKTNLKFWFKHYEFMKTKLKNGEDDQHIIDKQSVIKWILKYKFGGDDV